MNFHTDEEVFACFIDCMKKFEHLIWTKIMQILKKLIMNGTKDFAANCTWIRVLNNRTKRTCEDWNWSQNKDAAVTNSIQLIHQVL